MTNQDIYQQFTDRIVSMLEAGQLPPWRRPWSASTSGPDGFVPRNASSGREYRGINVWWLLMAAQDKGYTRNLWLTYNQAKQLGGHVRKGEKSEIVVLWKPTKGKDKQKTDGSTEKGSRYLLLRSYRVFNVEQCEGLDLPKKFQAVEESEPTQVQIDEKAEDVVTSYLQREDLALRFGGDRAYYHKIEDYIRVPMRDSFNGMNEYYSTVFHELGHSTGHAKRLDRESLKPVDMFGSHTYSREELVAEFCAAFVCGVTGVAQSIENNAAYLKVWAGKLRDEPKLLINAAAAAQKAADYILVGPESKEESAEAAE